MADATLKTDYKDDVLDTSKNTQRKYQMIQNEDGTVSFVDVTEYSQMGDSFGAKDVNAIAEAFNELNSNKAPKVHTETTDNAPNIGSASVTNYGHTKLALMSRGATVPSNISGLSAQAGSTLERFNQIENQTLKNGVIYADGAGKVAVRDRDYSQTSKNGYERYELLGTKTSQGYPLLCYQHIDSNNQASDTLQFYSNGVDIYTVCKLGDTQLAKTLRPKEYVTPFVRFDLASAVGSAQTSGDADCTWKIGLTNNCTADLPNSAVTPRITTNLGLCLLIMQFNLSNDTGSSGQCFDFKMNGSTIANHWLGKNDAYNWFTRTAIVNITNGTYFQLTKNRGMIGTGSTITVIKL